MEKSVPPDVKGNEKDIPEQKTKKTKSGNEGGTNRHTRGGHKHFFRSEVNTKTEKEGTRTERAFTKLRDGERY